MKKNYFFILLLFISYYANSQTYALSIGSLQKNISFNSTAYDSNDGGIINVGYINDSSNGNGNDCYLVKFDKDHNILWQKRVSNNGDDYIKKVTVCKNGDYIIVGKLTQAGISRGFVSRIDKATGNIIWSFVSSNSSIGEIYYDVVETVNGNIAISGTDSYSPSITNIYILLLDSKGTLIWSKVSAHANSDEPFAINQLDNGNLIIGAFEWVGFYKAILMELDQTTGTTLTENSYSVDTTAPNSGLIINSIWPINIKIKNRQVSIYSIGFEGSGSTPIMYIHTYDQVTKNLTGNIYFHTGDVNALDYAFTPIASNDYLIAQSFANPSKVYISRVTNGSIVYDDSVTNSVSQLHYIDTTKEGAVYSGQSIFKNSTNAYNFLSPRTNPSEGSSCGTVVSTTLVLLPSTLYATSTSDIVLNSSGSIDSLSLSFDEPNYSDSIICNSVLATPLLNFNATFNELNKAVQLNWQTSNEVNNNHFEIQHSIDDKNFTSLGNVKSLNSTAKANYLFTDVNPVAGLNFYRLKQVDNDGTFIYSKIISVNIKNNSPFSAYPNPTFDNINLTIPLSTKTSEVRIYDMSGKLMLTQQLGYNINNKQLNINKLAPGVYNMILIQGSSRYTLKLIKN